MKSLVTVSADEAKKHFLKGSSYFNGDFPDYISFEPILKGVAEVLDGKGYASFQGEKPSLNIPLELSSHTGITSRSS